MTNSSFEYFPFSISWLNVFQNIEHSNFSVTPQKLLADKYFENIIVDAAEPHAA